MDDETRVAAIRKRARRFYLHGLDANELIELDIPWLLDRLRTAEAERDAAVKEMHARELHHFESETLLESLNARVSDAQAAAWEAAMSTARTAVRESLSGWEAARLEEALNQPNPHRREVTA